MDRGTAVLLTALAGGVISLQAPVNALLGDRIGTPAALFVSFLVGTVALLGLVVAAGDVGRVGGAGAAPWWMLTGGVMGAVFVTSLVVTIRSLGVGGITAAAIAGQLVVAVVVDHFGWLGVERQPASFARVAGIALLAAGTFLVVRE